MEQTMRVKRLRAPPLSLFLCLKPTLINTSMAQITLRPHQAQMLFTPHRFVAACLARRSGKTYITAQRMMLKALWEDDFKTPTKNKTIWYVTTSYTQAEDIMWKQIQDLVPPGMLKRKWEMNLELVNGSIIQLKGGANTNSLVGNALDFLALDEASLLDEEVFNYLLPTLATTNGQCWLTFTPRGTENWTYKKFMLGTEADNELWRSFHINAYDAGILSPEAIEAQKASMDERTFDQEFNANFLTAAGRIYYAFEPNENVADVQDNGTILYVGMDFNVDPMCANISVKAKDPKTGQTQLHTIDEIVIKDSNTFEMCAEINNRYKGRRIVVCPDASGQNRSTNSIESNHAIIRQHGMEVLAANSNPSVIDRINSVNSMLCNMNGDRRWIIHPRCKETIRCLQGQSYKPGTSLPDKKSGFDHMNDASGYTIMQLFPLNTNKNNAQVHRVVV